MSNYRMGNDSCTPTSYRKTGQSLMTMLRFACALGLTGLFMGCAPDSEIISEGEFLYFETIGMGQTGAVSDVAEWVVRDSVSWVLASDSLHPLAPFKPVRFDQTVVVAIAIPEESGGYSIEVESVERLEDEIVINYLLQEPAGDCITLAAPALPFLAIAVRRFEEERVSFVRRTQNYECTWRQN